MGIVGYAWLFPQPGISSDNLIPNYCQQTTKDELFMGDIIVNPGVNQLMWNSWADTAKTTYWGI